MGFAHNVSFNITGDFRKEQLEKFLEQVPPGGQLSTKVHIVPKDRPWESERTTVELQARWITE